ncbi:MAG: apolipoprotein N-acyltransferase [Halothiobacillaceae bacterium]|nr:MAG: apolipoprotein N-acyltransferase [Halothiobacillaceae bacterium]
MPHPRRSEPANAKLTHVRDMHASSRASALLQSRCLSRLLALALGALLPLAFAPFGLWPLAILSVAGLFRLWRDADPREAFALGYLFGLGQFGVGVSWIYVSMHLFGEAIAPVAGLITLAFVALAAAFPAVAGWLAARLSAPNTRTRLFLALPLAWLLLELVRGIFLGGFPWLNLGASQLGSPLAGYGPVLGEYGMTLAVVLSAAALAALTRPWLALPILALVWAGGWLLKPIAWTEPAGPPIGVAIVQGNVQQARKFDPEQYEATLRTYRELTERHRDARLILWPETAVPDLVSQAAPFLIEMQDKARDHGIQIVAGVFDEDRFGHYYNALMTLPVEGGRYHKRHLVAFGEYLPLRVLIEPFKAFIQVPMSDLSSGADEQAPMRLAGYPAGASICYEAALSRKIRTALPEAAFLINASNDAWFGDSLAPHQHLQIAAMRALETGRWMARATNTGISALIDPQGRVTARTPQFEQAVLRGAITPMQGGTPFVRWGEGPLWLLALLGLAALGFRRYMTAERMDR